MLEDLALRLVAFVNRLIGEGATSFVPAKITKALDFAKPMTLREVHSLLDLVNIFHEQIGRIQIIFTRFLSLKLAEEIKTAPRETHCTLATSKNQKSDQLNSIQTGG